MARDDSLARRAIEGTISATGGDLMLISFPSGTEINQWTSKVEIQAVLLTASLGLIAYLLRLIFTRRGRIWWSQVANTTYLVPQEENRTAVFYSHQYYIMNSGRKEVEDLEISLNYRPQHMEIFPHIPWTPTINPDGRLIITFKNANKGELIFLSMLSKDGECPGVTNVRFKGGVGKKISMTPQRLYKPLTLYTIAAILAFGLISAVYNMIKIIFIYFT